MVAGYRSPLRPIPMDCIPDSSFFFDSRQLVDEDELTSNNLDYEFVDNNEGRVLLYSNGSDLDNCNKDSWWLEAIKVADDIESKPERSMFNDMVSLLRHLIFYCSLVVSSSFHDNYVAYLLYSIEGMLNLLIFLKLLKFPITLPSGKHG